MTTRGTAGADAFTTNRKKDTMYLNLNAALFAFTLWLLAAVLAWLWGHPAIAGALLIVQAVGFIALALWDGRASGPTLRVRRRGQP